LHSTQLNITIPFDLWIVQKFSCGQTKCEAIVVNVLVPFAMLQILEEMETVKYISVMVDTLNHKSLKLVHVLV
jgi:hypothetical protein